MLFPDTLSISSVPVSIEELEDDEDVVVEESELLLLFPAEFEDVVEDPEPEVPAVLPVLVLLDVDVVLPVPVLELFELLAEVVVLLELEVPEYVPEFPLYELYEL